MLGKTIAKVVVGSGLLAMLITCTSAEGKQKRERRRVDHAATNPREYRDDLQSAPEQTPAIPSPALAR